MERRRWDAFVVSDADHVFIKDNVKEMNGMIS